MTSSQADPFPYDDVFNLVSYCSQTPPISLVNLISMCTEIKWPFKICVQNFKFCNLLVNISAIIN